ncbi:Com family DNA-binding transcriptional regulator [Alkalihalobacterium alkalinitrilicum]
MEAVLIAVRCCKCNKLLGKLEINAKAELKCPKCKTMNKIK